MARAAYFVIALRHNPLRLVLLVALAAVLAQPLWGADLSARIHEHRPWRRATRTCPNTEFLYLQRGLQGWTMISAIARLGHAVLRLGSVRFILRIRNAAREP
jgi:hypothetical protein